MASRVPVIDLTLDDDVHVCIIESRQKRLVREHKVIGNKKTQKKKVKTSDEAEAVAPAPAPVSDEEEQEALIQDMLAALNAAQFDVAGMCLMPAASKSAAVFRHYAPDPELDGNPGDDPFVLCIEEIMNDAEMHFCF
jgi:hypothetical protein